MGRFLYLRGEKERKGGRTLAFIFRMSGGRPPPRPRVVGGAFLTHKSHSLISPRRGLAASSVHQPEYT